MLEQISLSWYRWHTERMGRCWTVLDNSTIWQSPPFTISPNPEHHCLAMTMKYDRVVAERMITYIRSWECWISNFIRMCWYFLSVTLHEQFSQQAMRQANIKKNNPQNSIRRGNRTVLISIGYYIGISSTIIKLISSPYPKSRWTQSKRHVLWKTRPFWIWEQLLVFLPSSCAPFLSWSELRPWAVQRP